MCSAVYVLMTVGGGFCYSLTIVIANPTRFDRRFDCDRVIQESIDFAYGRPCYFYSDDVYAGHGWKIENGSTIYRFGD